MTQDTSVMQHITDRRHAPAAAGSTAIARM